jgi:hypothetical protein
VLDFSQKSKRYSTVGGDAFRGCFSVFDGNREGCEDWQAAAPTSNVPVDFEFGIRNASMFHGNSRNQVTILTHTRDHIPIRTAPHASTVSSRSWWGGGRRRPGAPPFARVPARCASETGARTFLSVFVHGFENPCPFPFPTHC